VTEESSIAVAKSDDNAETCFGITCGYRHFEPTSLTDLVATAATLTDQGKQGCIGFTCKYRDFRLIDANSFYCKGTTCRYDRFVYTEDFTRSKNYVDYCTGIGCFPSFEYAAARRASQDDPEIVPYLLERFDGAPRAAQIYIALVVRIHDPAAGQALLQRLSKVQGERVLIFSGCGLRGAETGELANSYIAQPNFRFD